MNLTVIFITIYSMSTNQTKLQPIPGLDMVGRGIYLRPQLPFELKNILFQHSNEQEYFSKETHETYLIPEGYEINDSPPMPASQALNQTRIEESWERFEKESSLDASAAVSNAPFSVNVNASQTSQLRVNEEAYYATRNSFIPLWTVYIANARNFLLSPDTSNIPTPFSHNHRAQYEKFFEQYGTHYIKRVWVGGKATLVFSIVKSSSMSKEDIQAGLKASQIAGSVSVNAKLQENKEKLQNNSQCTVFGKGGDELKLAALSTLDETCYNQWLTTISQNPQVIEFDACGIWTLIDDVEKANAIKQAYTEATVFTPLRAMFNLDNYIHVFRGDQYFNYDPQILECSMPTKASKIWPVLEKVGFEQVDAAFIGKYLTSQAGEDLSRKLYFFNRGQYIRVDADSKAIDPGYPKTIAEGWPGVNFERVDAVLNAGINTLYFFYGKQYIRFNMLTHHADEAYPEFINKRWPGLTFDKIDAAVYWGNSKVYFFRDNQHIRFDMVNYMVDPGYPKFIIGNYVEDWKFLA
jgi:hypothetical protein